MIETIYILALILTLIQIYINAWLNYYTLDERIEWLLIISLTVTMSITVTSFIELLSLYS